MGDIILKTTDLTKKYNNKVVVDNLNIDIRKGEIFGLLGPNGAGKIIACGTSEELKKLVNGGDENITLEEVFLTLTGKNLEITRK